MDDKFNCHWCGKENTKRRNTINKYCNNQCQGDERYHNNVLLWKSGDKKPNDMTLKRYLSEQREGCWECGITEWNGKDIVLELEHKNGYSQDNSEENLSLLCPNCHSQTDTYKGKNKGKGRHFRKVRYAKGLSY
jgi:hypothetical protein